MIIDYTFFSYGAGLVLCGFVGGICINAFLASIRAVR